jgi:hypothetical protein
MNDDTDAAARWLVRRNVDLGDEREVCRALASIQIPVPEGREGSRFLERATDKARALIASSLATAT